MDMSASRVPSRQVAMGGLKTQDLKMGDQNGLNSQLNRLRLIRRNSTRNEMYQVATVIVVTARIAAACKDWCVRYPRGVVSSTCPSKMPPPIGG